MKAVFLDRDGTIIVDRGYLSDPGGVEFIAGAIDALRRLQSAGFWLVFISNQSGIGRGLLTSAQSDAVHQRVLELLYAEGIVVARSYMCPHAPWENCLCRKPSPVLLQQAATELGVDLDKSVMIGDKKSDIDAGRAAGCRTVLYAPVETKDNAGAVPHYRSGCWAAIARWVLG